MTTRKSERVVLVAILMATQTIGWGTTFSQVGILTPFLMADLNISRTQVFLGATVLYVLAALTAPLAGRLADRLGGLTLLIPGSAVLAASLWLLAQSEGLISYLLPWALMGLVFHVGLVTSVYTALSQVLGRDAVWAISTVTIATGLCSAIFWPLSDWLLRTHTWREVLLIYAQITALGCLPLHVLLWLRFGHIRAGKGRNAPKPAPAHIKPSDETIGQRLMIAMACVGSLLAVGFGVAVIEVFTVLGTPRADAVLAGSAMGAAYVVSRLIMLSLSARITPVYVAQVTYVALALCFLPPLLYALLDVPLPGNVAIAVAFVFGLPAGLVGLLRSLFPLYLFGSEDYGARLGVQARATELASAIAPFGFTLALGFSPVGLLAVLTGASGFAVLAAFRMRRQIAKPHEIPNAL